MCLHQLHEILHPLSPLFMPPAIGRAALRIFRPRVEGLPGTLGIHGSVGIIGICYIQVRMIDIRFRRLCSDEGLWLCDLRLLRLLRLAGALEFPKLQANQHGQTQARNGSRGSTLSKSLKLCDLPSKLKDAHVFSCLVPSLWASSCDKLVLSIVKHHGVYLVSCLLHGPTHTMSLYKSVTRSPSTCHQAKRSFRVEYRSNLSSALVCIAPCKSKALVEWHKSSSILSH